MPKRSSPPSQSSFPSREDILGFVAGATSKISKREIARAFNVRGEDRSRLKNLLKDLEAEGVIGRHGKRIHRTGQLPAVVLADIRCRDRDGDIVAVPAEWDPEANGPAPTIVISPPRRASKGVPAPGIGDRALIRVSPLKGDVHRYSGRIIKVLEKSAGQVLGIFRPLPGGGGRLVPVDKKSRDRELEIRPGDEGEAEEGDLVTVTTSRSNRFGLPTAKVRERLGSVKSEKALSLIAIHAHGIPNAFSPAVLREAEEIAPVSLNGREDWRDLPFVTIDPPDAKDHDDAVHATPDPDPENRDGFIINVAIADVAAYVRPGTALDREALERGNSVYFPDRVVPMLPERISNDLCSLRPQEDRPALAVRITVASDGRKLRHSFHRVLIRSAARLAYAQAQAAIDGRPDEVTAPLLDPVLKPLWQAYECVKLARERRQPLDLELPERKILLKPEGTVDRVFVPERLDAHRLIEEFMILANVAAAESLEQAKSDLIYRVHDEPSLEKLRALGEVLASIGRKLRTQDALTPSLFNNILESVKETEHRLFVNEVVLRTQSQAEYAAENYGHFGLNLRRYAHFTSPIRRYADLIVHRALIRMLGGQDGLPADMTREELAEIAAQISTAERRAMAAERETIDRLIAHYLADRIGATFEAQISGVTKSGLFVRLLETGADGFVPVSSLGADYYRYEEAQHALTGEQTGESFRLGDRVQVRLLEAAPVAGALRFEILSEGRQVRSGRGSRPRSRTPVAQRAPRRVSARVKDRSRKQ
ncbi:ribonuclease R [Microvirga massiliensis]|uniref:ribonuclease R n=1 Tax=Microvirga massiliensis TaxID=1033741 RepID=UPI00062BB0E3|nr:ribonuclease R [Microvirga massiliensis]